MKENFGDCVRSIIALLLETTVVMEKYAMQFLVHGHQTLKIPVIHAVDEVYPLITI